MTKEKNVKLFRTFLVATAMIMMLAVPVQAQASAKSTYKKAVDYYKNERYKKANKLFKKLPENANEKCVKNMSKKVKSAYLKTVKNYAKKSKKNWPSGKYMWGYFLTDIDKDGKAELVIEYGHYEADVETYVYQYKNGKAKKIGYFPSAHMSFYYDPSGNGMTVFWGQMSCESIFTVKIKNGKLKYSVWGNGRDLLESHGEYMDLPYRLDSHSTYKSTGYKYDYSPLK